MGRFVFSVFFLVPFIIALEVPIFLSGAALGTYLVFSKNLPVIPNLESYEPRTVSTFYADDGTVIGVFYKQKRFVVDLSQIPPHAIKAFLAAEDSRFYEHSGVDWMGITRAMLRNIAAGRITQGGSTITMQVTKNFLLSRERTYDRKIKELILASQLENVWGKDKILHVYLNEIYLGEGSYGVEAAARGYFDKPVEHLSVAEAALLAGLVASPARFNPFKSEELARQRQLTVLGRMLRAGFITQEDYQKAQSEPLKFKKEAARPFDLVPDFAEAVRRYIVRKYGEDRLYNEGLKVFTTCRVDYQRQALEAMEKGLEEIRSRQKNLAILRNVPKEEIPELLQKRNTPELQEGKIYQGVVTKATVTKAKQMDLEVWLSKRLKGIVRLDRPNPAYKVGQVLALRFERFADEIPVFSLDNDPKLQGALVCIENKTGFVRALVGGASGDHFKFNRATQAKRQPGSAFKPLVYSVAIEEKSYSPATIIIDDPIEVELENADEDWKPRNAGGNFLGPLSFRRALELSRNICTIKILIDVGIDPVIKLARRMGITSALGRNPSISLGTSEVSLYELTSAYTVFPNSGVHVEPVLVKRIEDRLGNVLEDNTEIPLLDESEIPRPVPREEFRELVATASQRQGFQGDEEQELRQDTQRKQAGKANISEEEITEERSGARRVTAALSPQTSYIMTQLLQGGVRQGTGSRMSHYLKRRDLAGKTGTTNNAEDTWFVGFSPDFTTGVWVGFDEKRPLGNREEGARAALPIWGYFMSGVLKDRREREFPVPPDITFKDMLTFSGSPGEGFVPKMVREPVYTPFAGITLITSPNDPPEELAQYRGIVFPVTPAPEQSPYGALPQQPHTSPAAVYPVQPGTAVPLHPMDGRNLFPTQHPPPPPAQRPATQPQQWNPGAAEPRR
ncbi:MAG: PBP1A family penicillin-binding protein, partial [Desulfomonile tiedjei]|nr:PBP1A family penicillin-binding protein [Desulfomonile tiedjei]